jgi:hypothetical protein
VRVLLRQSRGIGCNDRWRCLRSARATQGIRAMIRLVAAEPVESLEHFGAEPLRAPDNSRSYPGFGGWHRCDCGNCFALGWAGPYLPADEGPGDRGALGRSRSFCSPGRTRGRRRTAMR